MKEEARWNKMDNIGGNGSKRIEVDKVQNKIRKQNHERVDQMQIYSWCCYLIQDHLS